MTPTLRYYTHISSTSFGQTLSLPAAIVPGQMSVENLYQRASPRSYVLMAVEWEGGGGGNAARDVVRGQGWITGSDSRCSGRLVLHRRVL